MGKSLVISGVDFEAVALARNIYTQHLNVSVKDSSNVPITGATVSLNNGYDTITPTSAGGGMYTFANIDNGAYTLTIVRAGYETHTESLVIDGASVSKSVTLEPITRINMLAHAEFFNNWNSYINGGQYCAFAANGRGTILVPNAYVDTPITWYPTYKKDGYSPVEVPSGAHSVDILFTNPTYKVYIYVGKQSDNSGNGLINYTLKAGEPFRLVMSDYATAAHIVIAVRRVDDDDANYTGTSISDLGLTCYANMGIPMELTYDMTPNTTLLNGVVTSNNDISANTKRASLVVAKATNVKYKAFYSGDRLATDGATYAKGTIPVGTKAVRVTMTDTDHSVAFFRLIQQTDTTVTDYAKKTVVDNDNALSWSQGRALPYELELPFNATDGKYFQCNIARNDQGDVDTSIEELGLKVEFVL